MRNLLLFIVWIIVLLPAWLFAWSSSFTDLDDLCTWQNEWLHREDEIILKHIDKKITKAKWYVKTDGYLYMDANTFTDNYRFLWSYFLRYDCRDRKIEKLSQLLKGNVKNEFAIIWYDEDTWNIGTSHWEKAFWVYDYEKNKVRKINYSKIKPLLKGYFIATSPKLATYDWYSIDIEILYYTKIKNEMGGYSYSYTNYGNPEIMKYTF